MKILSWIDPSNKSLPNQKQLCYEKKIFNPDFGVCLTLIATVPAEAQNYAKVTVYTNLRQDVDGVFRAYQVTGTYPGNLEWTGYFHFDRYEGGITADGYIYQKWVLLSGMAFSPGGTSFKMITSCYGQSCTSPTYQAGSWPIYLEIQSFDFRTQSPEE